MSKNQTTSSGQKRVAGGYHIKDPDALIDAYDQAIELLEKKRPESDVRGAMILASCARADAGEPLAPCIAAKGECPQNIEQLASATFGNIMAYTGDKDHPIARCVPVAMVNKTDNEKLSLHAELMQLLLKLKTEVGPQLDNLMLFHQMVTDCSVFRTEDTCAQPVVGDARRCLWNKNGSKCSDSAAWSTSKLRLAADKLKTLRAQLAATIAQLSAPEYDEFNEQSPAPFDAGRAHHWRTYKHLTTRRQWLEAQITTYEDASNLAISIISNSFDDFASEKGTEAMCASAYDTIGACGGDSRCQVVVVGKGEGPYDGQKVAEPENTNKRINNSTTMCLSKGGQEVGRWRWDKETGKVLLLNADGSPDKVMHDKWYKTGSTGFTRKIAAWWAGKSVAQTHAELADKVLDAAFDSDDNGVALGGAAKARSLQRRIVLLDASIRPYLKDEHADRSIGVYAPNANTGEIECKSGLLEPSSGDLKNLATDNENAAYLNPKNKDEKSLAALKTAVKAYTKACTDYQLLLQELEEENPDQVTEIAGVMLSGKFTGAQAALAGNRGPAIAARQKLYFLLNCAAYSYSTNEEANYYWGEDRRTMDVLGQAAEAAFRQASGRTQGVVKVTVKADKSFHNETTTTGRWPARADRLVTIDLGGKSYQVDALYLRKRYTNMTVGEYVTGAAAATNPKTTLYETNQNGKFPGLTGQADPNTGPFTDKDQRSLPVVRIGNKWKIDTFMDKTKFPGKQLYRSGDKQTVNFTKKANFAEQRVKLAQRNRDMRKAANIDFQDASNVMAKLGLQQYFGSEHNAGGRDTRMEAREQEWRITKWARAGVDKMGFWRRNRVRGGDAAASKASNDAAGSIHSMSTAGDHMSARRSTTLADMVSDEESFGAVGAEGSAGTPSLMSTEVPGVAPRMQSDEESFGSASLLSTEVPRNNNNNSFGTVSLMSTATHNSRPQMLPASSKASFVASVVASEEEFLERVSGNPSAAASPATASLDVDRVYEEFYAGADLQSSASSVSHLY